LAVKNGAADKRDDEVLRNLSTDEVDLAGLGEPGTCEEDPALCRERGGEGRGMGVTEEGGTGRGGELRRWAGGKRMMNAAVGGAANGGTVSRRSLEVS